MKKILSIFIILQFIFNLLPVSASNELEKESILVEKQLTENLSIVCEFSSKSLEELINTSTTSQDIPCILYGLNQDFSSDSTNTEPIQILGFLNARYYDGSRGQFTQQDPVFWELGMTEDGKKALYNPQLLNSYSYGANNPITNKDPEGRISHPFLTGLAVGFSLGVSDQDRQGLYDSINNPNASAFEKSISSAAIGLLGYAEFGPGKVEKTGVNLTGEIISKNGNTIIDKATSLIHTISRHAWNSTAENASKFNKGEDIVKLILNSSGVEKVKQAGLNYERVIDAGRNIGTDIKTGTQTNFYKVILDKADKVITAFPFTPK